MNKERLRKIVMIAFILITGSALYAGRAMSAEFIGTCSNGEWYQVFATYPQCMKSAGQHQKSTGHVGSCR